MYEVLIVDDEPLARDSLKYLIDWPTHGYRITAEAGDGKKALELMQQQHFSLVLTDIRMPTMNGLEFIEKLRKFSDAQIIILSGYEDFEYARQGLKLGVNDYLLKPVDEDDLIEVLNRIKEEIAEKQLLQRQHHLGLSVLRDQFLRKLAYGQISRKEYVEQCTLLGMRAEEMAFGCLLIELDFLSDGISNLTEWEVELKRFAVRNVLEELCGLKGYVFEQTEERYGLMLTGSLEDMNESHMLMLAMEIAEAIRINVKETVSIGIGNSVESGIEFIQSFQRAEQALDGKFLRGNDSILTLPKSTELEPKQQTFQFLQDEVLLSIKSYREDRVSAAIDQLWEGFKNEGLQGDQIRTTVLETLVQLLQLVKSVGANPDQLFHYELGDYERVMKARTIDELYPFMTKKCRDVLQLLNQLKDMKPTSVVGAVKKIVQEQYHSNVSLRSVAGQVFLNPNYLGKVFKAGTELSFNEYLLQVRMEKAKELLLQTDKKVYEIAQEVGYGELDWFYKRFKAYTGISAGEYCSQYGK